MVTPYERKLVLAEIELLRKVVFAWYDRRYYAESHTREEELRDIFVNARKRYEDETHAS